MTGRPHGWNSGERAASLSDRRVRYLDYRTFLADFYEAKKRRGFSYRAFSRATGLGAPNYLKLVIAGKRNLTPVMAERFAASCGLANEPAAYFQQLVAFNQAKTAAERNRSYERLTGFRRYRQVQKLELAHAAYHSTWYLPAIRELCASAAFLDDHEWLAGVLRPPIKASEAKNAIDLLLELGLLERDVSKVAACERYERHWFDGSSGDEVTCAADLLPCNALASTGVILRTVGHRDVQAALAEAENPVRLGDLRASDMFRITIGMRQLELGGSCEGAPPDCTPVPPGVEALRTLLQQIDQVYSAPMAPCAAIADSLFASERSCEIPGLELNYVDAGMVHRGVRARHSARGLCRLERRRAARVHGRRLQRWRAPRRSRREQCLACRRLHRRDLSGQGFLRVHRDAAECVPVEDAEHDVRVRPETVVRRAQPCRRLRE